MTLRHSSAFHAAALLGAAVFICGCASHQELKAAVANADAHAWDQASPGTLEALRSEHASVELVPLGGSEEIGFVTAYATPRLRASRVRAGQFVHPLHRSPEGGIYATRREIHENDLLEGGELCWVDNSLDAYLVQVNGSAGIAWVDENGMETGEESVIVWSASNDHDYTSLGRLAIEQGLAHEDEMSLMRLRSLHATHPEDIEALMLENSRFIMFRELAADEKLQGSRGRTLVPSVSLAADPGHPTDAVLLVEPADGSDAFLGIVHDGGAAIVGPQRVDRYLGVGDEAMSAAGEIAQPARVYLVKIEMANRD